MRMSNTSRNNTSGFTLIELLMVIAIIGILSAIIVASVNTSRSKSRDAQRRAAMLAMQNALELYRLDNGSFPNTGGAWWGVSASAGSRATSGPNAYIPGLTPVYMNTLPTDPLGITTEYSGYLYRSDGVDYKLLSHIHGPESFPAPGQPFHDPVRPTHAWMLCSENPGPCNNW